MMPPEGTPVTILRSPVEKLVRGRTLVPSSPSILTRVRRARLSRRAPPPQSRMLRVPVPADRWNCLFLFAPGIVLDPDQRAILARVRALAGHLLVVVATPTADAVPDELALADALIWKDLPGFDFSAYALALDAVARFSPGATAYMQNDSVLGPFADIDALVDEARWDLTGFTGSPAVEEHLSSFAFVLKDVTPARCAALASVLSTRWSYNAFAQVVMLQETRLARVAARTMTVGSLWYLPAAPAEPALLVPLMRRLGLFREKAVVDTRGDATLSFPLALLDQGFPFLKRSLLTKFAGLVPEEALRARLAALGWDRPAPQPSRSSASRLAVVPQKASGS